MTAPKIALRKIEDLTPDPRNARTHSVEQIETIIASIERFGWTNPCLVDDLIRAGHGRVSAASLIYQRGGRIYMAPGKERGGAVLPIGTVPVIDCTGWTEEERTAYALADNQIALQAGWDMQALSTQLDELMAIDFNIGEIGFDTAALESLGLLGVGNKARTDPDEVPEPPANPVTKLGDVWLLGAKVKCPKCGKTTPAGRASV